MIESQVKTVMDHHIYMAVTMAFGIFAWVLFRLTFELVDTSKKPKNTSEKPLSKVEPGPEDAVHSQVNLNAPEADAGFV